MIETIHRRQSVCTRNARNDAPNRSLPNLNPRSAVSNKVHLDHTEGHATGSRPHDARTQSVGSRSGTGAVARFHLTSADVIRDPTCTRLHTPRTHSVQSPSYGRSHQQHDQHLQSQTISLPLASAVRCPRPTMTRGSVDRRVGLVRVGVCARNRALFGHG